VFIQMIIMSEWSKSCSPCLTGDQSMGGRSGINNISRGVVDGGFFTEERTVIKGLAGTTGGKPSEDQLSRRNRVGRTGNYWRGICAV